MRANLKQYGTENRYIDVVVGDSSLPLWHEQLKLDSIVTDRKYNNVLSEQFKVILRLTQQFSF